MRKKGIGLLAATSRSAIVVGNGPVVAAIRAALKHEGFPQRSPSTMWIVVGRDQEIEGMLEQHPARSVIVIADVDTPIMQRCRWLELGAAYVIVPPIFPREVVAVVRSVWRASARALLCGDELRKEEHAVSKLDH